jgi:hypothetical protein
MLGISCVHSRALIGCIRPHVTPNGTTTTRVVGAAVVALRIGAILISELITTIRYVVKLQGLCMWVIAKQ